MLDSASGAAPMIQQRSGDGPQMIQIRALVFGSQDDTSLLRLAVVRPPRTHQTVGTNLQAAAPGRPKLHSLSSQRMKNWRCSAG